MLGRIICFIICMFLWFNIQPSIFPDGVGKLIYHGLPLFIFIVCYKETVLLIKSIEQYKALFCFSMILYVMNILWGLMVATLFNGEYSYLVFTANAMSAMIRFVGMAILAVKVFPNSKGMIAFFKLCIICNATYAFCSIIFLAFPDIKSLWSQMIVLPESMPSRGDIIQESTRYGLAGYSGFNSTIFCSVAVWMCLVLMEYTQGGLFWWINLVLLLCGNMMYGRSGLIISIMMIMASYLRNITFKKTKNLIYLLLVAFLIISIAVKYAENDPILSVGLSWAVEPVDAFIVGVENGELSFGDSGNDLVDNMYFLPSDDATILIGDGKYSNGDGSYYMHTDAGFMRNMLFYGVLGSVCLYGMLGILFFMLYRVFKEKEKVNSFYLLLLVLCVLLMEFKGTTMNFFPGVILGIICSYKLRG